MKERINILFPEILLDDVEGVIFTDVRNENSMKSPVEIPTEIYPELRKVFIFIFENSGFREIKIDPNVDFKKLYLSRKN